MTKGLHWVLRKCTSKIPSVKAKFQALVESQVTKHNLHIRVSELFKKVLNNEQFTTTDEEEYESIEDRMQRAIKYGDKKCRKARLGPVALTSQSRKD
jgi:hypothetical protein